MPKITKEAMEERREQIIAAAMRVFGQKGLSNATLRDVFREAGLSAGAVYNYFSSKEEILLAVTQAGMSHALSALRSSDAKNPTIDEVIDHFLKTLEAQRKGHTPRIDIMIVNEALSNKEIFKSVSGNRQAVKNALTRLVIRKQQSESSWCRFPAEVLAELLYSTYQGLILSVALGEDIDLRQVGEALSCIKFD